MARKLPTVLWSTSTPPICSLTARSEDGNVPRRTSNKPPTTAARRKRILTRTSGWLMSRRAKGKALSASDKLLNRILCGTRVKVEHALAGVKRCRIVKDVFRLTKQGSDLNGTTLRTQHVVFPVA